MSDALPDLNVLAEHPEDALIWVRRLASEPGGGCGVSRFAAIQGVARLWSVHWWTLRATPAHMRPANLEQGDEPYQVEEGGERPA